MAFPRIAGSGVALSLGGALGSQQTFPSGVISSTGFTQGTGSNVVTLAAGELVTIPAGTYMIAPGPYTSLQFLDPVTLKWTTVNGDMSIRPVVIDSDGGNFRLANLTGLPVGALITTSSSNSYTNGIGTAVTGLTITPSAGGSVWVPVVGGQLQLAASSGSVAPITAGSGYLFPPIVVIGPPPAGGIQATGHVAVMSGGGIQSGTGFVLDNYGAGYTTAPTVTLINDPRDGVGSGAAVKLSLNASASGYLTAMYPAGAFAPLGTASGTGGYGLPQTSAITFTFSPAGPAATAIMNFCLTGITMTTSGAGMSTGAAWLAFTGNEVISATNYSAAYANPLLATAATFPRQGRFAGAIGTVSGVSSAGIVLDSGYGMQQVPTMYVITGGTSVFTTNPALVATVGGVTDLSYVQPM